jgi:hypothetical protein
VRRIRVLAIGIVLATLLVPGTDARAGTATIYQCVGPAGQPAATDMLSSPATTPALRFTAACGDPNNPWPMRLRDGVAPGASLGTGDHRDLLIAAPSGTRFVGGRLERQIFDYNYTTASSGLGYRLSTVSGAVLEQCGASQWSGKCQPTAGGTFQFTRPGYDLPVLSTTLLRVSFGCLGLDGSRSRCADARGAAGLALRRLALRVADDAAPVVTSLTGSPVGDQPVRRRELTLTASDGGLGLYRVLTYVDGALADTQPFAAASPACRDVDPATPDPYEFATARACPTAPSAAAVRLGHLPSSGAHALRIVLEDAAGNRTIALDRTASFALPVDELQCPRSGCVRRTGALNGSGASARARIAVSGRAVRRVPYGRRVAISGRVLGASGAPIGGALVDVTGQTRRLGAPPDAERQVRTGADGRFRVVVPKGPSRIVRLAYRARLGDPAPASAAVVRIRVRAAVRLTLRPAVVLPGRSVRVRGRVLGGPFPHGTLAELQALDGREWRTFKTLAVGRRGRYAYRYRFRHTSGPARFLWRVRVRAQAGLPYAASASRPRWVLVR